MIHQMDRDKDGSRKGSKQATVPKESAKLMEEECTMSVYNMRLYSAENEWIDLRMCD